MNSIRGFGPKPQEGYTMKKNRFLLSLSLATILFCACSTSSKVQDTTKQPFNYRSVCFQERCLQNRANHAIRKAKTQSDTIYVYGLTFNNWWALWYHKDNLIHSCIIYPNRIRWQKPIEAENFSVDTASVNKCFEISLYKDVQCFENTLDGEFVCMIVDSVARDSSVDSECLFSHDFLIGSLQYKLQYDLSKVLQINHSNTKR